MMTQVVILAAGRGSRLGALAADRPKCLAQLAGRPLLEWQLRAISAAGFEEVGVVTGYRAECLRPFGLRAWHNPRWAETNMVMSLLCAEDVLQTQADLIVAYGDIVYEPRLLNTLMATPGDVVTVVDRDWFALWQERFENPLEDAETLTLDRQDRIVEIGQRPRSLKEIDGQYVGLTRLTWKGKRALLQLLRAGHEGEWTPPRPIKALHLTDALAGLIQVGEDVHAATVRNGWVEVDTPGDLAAYEALWRHGNLERFLVLPGVPV